MKLLPVHLALRYLRSPKSHSAVNVISLVAVAGVAVATLAIVCVLSVFNGFTDVARTRLSVLDPPLKITPVAGKTLAGADSLAGVVLKAAPGMVAGVSQVVEEQALAIYGGRQLMVRLRGVGVDDAAAAGVESIIIDGEYNPGRDPMGLPLATLGVGAAISLGAHPGYYDWLRLYVPRRVGRINPAAPMAAFRGDSLLVSGVFQLNQTEYDNDLVIVPLDVARHLLDYDNEATALEVTLQPGCAVADARNAIAAALGPDYRVADRFEQQAATYRMIGVEKWVTMLLLVFILVVASFNIISTMSMLIIEKRCDMATYRSLGATRHGVAAIFGSQGFMISAMGAAAGIVSGVALCILQQQFGLIKLGGDPAQLSITEYPVRVSIADLLAVAAVAVGVGALVALVAHSIALGRMRGAVMAALVVLAVIPAAGRTPIRGDSRVDAVTMWSFVRQHNADFPIEIAQAFADVGQRYGIRADIAFCQAILETGWFRFTGGTAVTIEQNNFCGLGVTRLGVKGVEFASVEEGVTAQMQHLYAYACKDRLPKGETVIDPRFALVRRGCARHWEELSGRWAANKKYGHDILKLYRRLARHKPSADELPPSATTNPNQATDSDSSSAL